MKTTFVALVISVYSLSANACGFDLDGITSKNAWQVKSALETITKEFEMNPKTGYLHFKTKEEVKLTQVRQALEAARIKNVKVKQTSQH